MIRVLELNRSVLDINASTNTDDHKNRANNTVLNHARPKLKYTVLGKQELGFFS